jgi:Flp pilus assembly protein TadD
LNLEAPRRRRATKSARPAGALEALMRAPPDSQLASGAALLSDPYRAVRVEAARMLAGGIDGATEQQRRAFQSAAAEFVASQRYNADRPEARTALGSFELRRGDFARGVMRLEASITLDPTFAGAYVDLADAFRAAGQEARAEGTLRQGLKQLPRDATLHHSLGLALVRAKRGDEALRELEEATKLDPQNARFAYVYGVAQNVGAFATYANPVAVWASLNKVSLSA